jgi:dCMP deaminase
MDEKWILRYLKLAKEVGSWSKDPSTKVGAVVVGLDGQILSQGYNGFPRGITDHPELLENREMKYRLTIHAEMNCIYNASLSGVSLKGSSIFVYGLPVCHECAKGVIQAGIRSVYCAYDSQLREKWAESWSYSLSMFNQIDMSVQTFDSAIIK